MPKDLFSVVVQGVIERDEEVKATGEAAKKVDVGGIVDRAIAGKLTSDEFIDELAAAALRVSIARIKQQKALAVKQVKEEGIALRNADPRTLKPVTDVDIAAARAEEQLKEEQ